MKFKGTVHIIQNDPHIFERGKSNLITNLCFVKIVKIICIFPGKLKIWNCRYLSILFLLRIVALTTIQGIHPNCNNIQSFFKSFMRYFLDSLRDIRYFYKSLKPLYIYFFLIGWCYFILYTINLWYSLFWSNHIYIEYLSTYILCLSVCLFDCL